VVQYIENGDVFIRLSKDFVIFDQSRMAEGQTQNRVQTVF
jgi:hypothetical protein